MVLFWEGIGDLILIYFYNLLSLEIKEKSYMMILINNKRFLVKLKIELFLKFIVNCDYKNIFLSNN